MEYKRLGNSNLHISNIGFGCMSLQGSEAENIRLLHAAVDAGINYFDTADLYNKGENEKIVGKALQQKRKDLIIATKVGNQWRSDGSGWNWNPRKTYIIDAVEKSLQRLGTDYIDIYQLHGGTIQDPVDETISAFESLVQSGKIRFYGISSIRPNVIRNWVSRSAMSSVMMQYSLLDRRPEETALPLLQEQNIGVLARGSLAQGLLINKPAKPHLTYSAAVVAKAATAIKAAVTPERSETAVAIRFVLQHPAITAAIIGIRTMAQLNEAVSAAATAPLTPGEITRLQSIIPLPYYEEHR